MRQHRASGLHTLKRCLNGTTKEANWLMADPGQKPSVLDTQVQFFCFANELPPPLRKSVSRAGSDRAGGRQGR